MKATLSKYINNTYIAIWISLLGFIAALICNLAFIKASLGFFLVEIFFVLSIIFQIIIINKAFSSVEEWEAEEDVLTHFKRKVIAYGERSFGVTMAFVGFTFPLLFVEAYLGLSLKSMIDYGAIGAFSFSLLFFVALYFVNTHLVRKKVLVFSEGESEVYWRNYKRKRYCAILLLSLLSVTFIIHQFSTSIWGPNTVMKGTVFDDYNSFIEYMEREIPSNEDWGMAANLEYGIASSVVYYDMYGNETTKEEALTRRLEDKNGNVVCKYLANNESVVSVQYTPKDGTVLPIKVFTESDLKEAQDKIRERHIIFGVIYVVISLFVVLIYHIKREKLS